MKRPEEVAKRVLDVAMSLVLLAVLSPVMALAAVAVLVSMGRPVFFKQTRIGFHEKPFLLIKFRTMTEERDERGELLPESTRLTRVGRILRKTSIDELPQLWNVLRGDMSLVGPRPLFPEYLPYYTERERKRHLVRPGITGLAQVKGRNMLSWDERLELDVQYVETRSLVLDARIILQTVLQVLTSKGVVVVPGQLQGRLDKCRGKSAVSGFR